MGEAGRTDHILSPTESHIASLVITQNVWRTSVEGSQRRERGSIQTVLLQNMLSLNNLKARKNNRTIASRLQAKYVRGNTACADHEHTGWNLSPFTIVTPMVAPSAAFSRVSNFCH